MKIDILTIFPNVALAPLSESIVGRAVAAGKVELSVHDLRDWTVDKHRKVDDEPYGGGPGMVMKPDPFFAAVRELRGDGQARVVLMTPQGRRFDQNIARDYARDFAAPGAHLIILCGHYEGVDHRVVEGLVDDEISIGDYVLTNGALAAAVFVDALVRLIPGVLGDERSADEESFAVGVPLLEAPCYTRPPDFEGRVVPEVLLSGHHGKIGEWRREMALLRTKTNRPDMLGDEA